MIGMALFGGAAHDAEGQLLPRVVGVLQHLVEKLRIELSQAATPIRPSPNGRTESWKESTLGKLLSCLLV